MYVCRGQSSLTLTYPTPDSGLTYTHTVKVHNQRSTKDRFLSITLAARTLTTTKYNAKN